MQPLLVQVQEIHGGNARKRAYIQLLEVYFILFTSPRYQIVKSIVLLVTLLTSVREDLATIKLLKWRKEAVQSILQRIT